jgi:pyruvate dehydrogenase E2 component (dihydrolipoamide acetyltransferase)
MPQLSDTMTEGTVVKWHKKEGEKVKAGEEIADVETDKATMPMEAFDAGTLAYVAVAEGQKVKVGDLLAVVATAGENAAQVKEQAKASPKSGGAGEDAETSHPAQEPERMQARQDQVSAGTHGHTMAEAARQDDGKSGRARVTPLARRLAADKGVELSQIAGSGPDGRIVERDVMDAIEKGGSKSLSKAAPVARELPAVLLGGQQKTVGMTKMRSAIASALQRSKQTVPHFYETIDIDVEELTKLRERLNKQLEGDGVRLSVADFITKAVAWTLVRHPALNARFNAEKGEVTQYGDVNLGIAVAIPDGLIVPVLRGANQMGLRDIRQRTLDLVERARGQRLKREEMSDATFTISSLGVYGVREFSAIINPPEVGILAVGAAEKRAVVRGDAIVARTMLTVTLSCDHRVVDGATAAEFLKTLKESLQEPGMLLV